MSRRNESFSSGIAIAAVALALPVVWLGGGGGRAAMAHEQGELQAAQLPDGVTEEKIALGETLFSGDAGCNVCHGADAKGLPGMTADLTDDVWLYIEAGTYEALVAVVRDGVSADKTGGIPMPPRGGQDLSEEQVQALAAYLWSLNRRDK